MIPVKGVARAGRTRARPRGAGRPRTERATSPTRCGDWWQRDARSASTASTPGGTAARGREELAEICRITGAADIGVRMHWLYAGEKSPAILEQAGFAYDSTSGYNETVGYRAGTTQVFKPLDATATARAAPARDGYGAVLPRLTSTWSPKRPMRAVAAIIEQRCPFRRHRDGQLARSQHRARTAVGKGRTERSSRISRQQGCVVPDGVAGGLVVPEASRRGLRVGDVGVGARAGEGVASIAGQPARPAACASIQGRGRR